MFHIVVTPTFEKDIGKIDPSVAKRIIEKIEVLTLHDTVPGVPLSNLPKTLRKLRKQRVGDWRVLFWVNERKKEITLYAVEHRRSIYKRLK